MTSADEATPDQQPEPMLRVVKGHPTDEELAAIVLVLSAAADRPARTPTAPSRSGWSDYWRTVHQPLPMRGPDAWRRSSHP